MCLRDHRQKLQRPLSIVAGLLTFLFLGGYAAAQLKAGSTTLHALFDWPLWLGAVIGVVIVTVYCFAGGIRASIWTDAAQSIVMIGAMALLLGYCVVAVGGPSALLAQLEAIDPQLVQLVPSGLAFGFGLYLLGLTFGGIATIGQPHILIRFMAIDATDSIRKARNIYFVWYIFFSVAAFAVGLYSRVLLPDLTAGLDPLRDSGREYAAHLVQLGTEVVYLEFPGIIHGFTTLRKAIPSGQNDLEAFLDATKLMVERYR